ncbi:MAG: hypothetical protein V2I74_13310 [Erythrobacter sp.]|jgi:hypothetical protein|nr:hypothetical protein [Erythrobacter sp.]
MGFWDSIEGFEKIGFKRKPGDEPSFLEKLGDFVHDEDNRKVIGYALDLMTDGYLNADDLGQAEKDDQRQRKNKAEEGTLEERPQRSLAELQSQAAGPAAPAVAAPPPPVELPAVTTPIAAPGAALRRPGGFGRKGL